jgi:hypothetical protein
MEAIKIDRSIDGTLKVGTLEVGDDSAADLEIPGVGDGVFVQACLPLVTRLLARVIKPTNREHGVAEPIAPVIVEDVVEGSLRVENEAIPQVALRETTSHEQGKVCRLASREQAGSNHARHD